MIEFVQPMERESQEPLQLQERLELLIAKAKKVLENRFDCEISLREDQTLDLKPGRKLDSADQQLLGQVSAVLASEISQLQQRYQELLTLEKNFETMMDNLRSESPNVFSLDRFRRAKAEPTPEEPPAPSRKIYFAVPCFVEGRDKDERHNLAFEIHALSHRMAFLPFDDLFEDVKVSSDEIRDLGPLTIFIPEVAALTMAEQKAVLTYLRSPRHSQTPHIITSSQKTYSQLLQDRVVPVELLERLAVSLVRMTKPFEEYMKLGLVPFLYQSLLDPSLEKNP